MWGRVFDLSKRHKVDLDGFVLYAMPNDYIGSSIIRTKKYEPHVTKLLRHELRTGEVFLDIGGNIGYYTMLAASIVGESGKVICFEPNPQNLQLIYEGLLTNNFHNVVVYPYAASDRADILKFTTVGSNGGIVTEASQDQKYYLLVQSVRIDEIVSDQTIDFVKIDVEAHEPYVIRGMSKLIQQWRPKIITEFHPWAMRINNIETPKDYLVQLAELGYELNIIDSAGVVPLSPDRIMLHWNGLGQTTAHLDLYCRPT